MNSSKEELSPDDAFRLRGDESERQPSDRWESLEEAVSFSDIRDRVGSPSRDKFNCHSNKLTVHFRSKDDGGYQLTQADCEVVRTVIAGTVERCPEMEPVSVDRRELASNPGWTASARTGR